MKRRWPLLLFALVLLGLMCGTAAYVFLRPADKGQQTSRTARDNGAGSHQGPRAAPPKEAAPQENPQPHEPADTPAQQSQDEPAAAVQPVSHRPRGNWTSGKLAITPTEAVFEIARDYNQRVVLGVRNSSPDDLQVKAQMEPFGGGLLADFVGPGSDGKPLAIGAGKQVELSLYLFAQDANRPAYYTTVTLLDAKTGDRLAAAAVSVLLPLPEFDVEATPGDAEPGTLAIPVTLQNQGQTLTDLEVTPGDNLLGRVTMQPVVNHAYLPAGGSLEFRVVPRLVAGFRELEGDVVIRAAGQEQSLHLRFTLPAGKQVFVASAFSTQSTAATSWYCTNRPNVDTSIGGPFEGPIPPSSPNNPYLQQGQWAWQWGAIGPFRLHTVFGPAPTAGVPPPAGYRNLKGRVPLGISGSGGSGEETPTAPDEPAAPLPDDGKTVSNGQPISYPPVGETPRVDNPNQVTWRPEDGVHHGPRGRRVRRAYALYRPQIYDDNAPEAMLAYGRGEPSNRTILQVWHSNRQAGPGRQILFRAWDGFGQHPQTEKFALGVPDRFGQWPAVLALPERRALVVWEQAAGRDEPPSLVYRVSGPGYTTWTDAKQVPGAGADAKMGHYDPVAVLAPDGRVLLAWQRGAGADARIMLARSNADGEFDEPAAPDELPNGAERPVPRMAPDGTLYLAFVAPANAGDAGAGSSAKSDSDRLAVFVAVSRDGGRSFAEVRRVSAKEEDAGEADLLVHGDEVHVVYRSGSTWASRVMHTARAAGASDWPPATAVSPPEMYAEFPSLLPLRDGVRVEFYGDRRERVAGVAADAKSPPSETMIKRYQVALRSGESSSPGRLLTRYPTLRAAWLQVNFRLRTGRRDYRPHELKVLLNGEELFSQADIVPEGTFLLPVDPSLLRRDRDGVPQNVIGTRTEHMNRAHYSTATDFRLQARHVFLERLVVAASQEEADRQVAAETETVNHHRHDVGLFASLPLEPIAAEPKQGETVTVPLLVGNLGEAPAEGVRIEVFDTPPEGSEDSRRQPVAEPLEIGTLEPMQRFRRVAVEFPFGGKETYYITVRAEGDDFDAANNVHAVSFVTPPPEPISPRSYAAEDFAVAMADAPQPPYRCRFLNAAGKEVAVAYNGQLESELPSGTYHLAMTRFRFEGREVVFPEPFEHRLGEPLRLAVRTAVEISLPEKMPEVWRWELVQAGNPEQVVEWREGRHTMMHVPPGEYRVAIQPTQFDSARVVWPEVIKVAKDDHLVLRLRSGFALRLPEQAKIWNWSAVVPGEPDAPVQWQRGASPQERTMLLPPGEYQVAIEPSQFHSSRLLWPKKLTVEPGKITTANLDSLVRLELPETVSDIHAWDVAPADHPDDPLQTFWYDVAQRRVMLVPPGEYRLAVKPTQFYSQRLQWPESFRVEPGKTTTVRLDSLVRLELPEKASGIHAWDVAPADHPDEPLQTFWYDVAQRRVMLMPPGEYRLAVKPTQFYSQRLQWPESFHVAPGKTTTVRLDGILRLELPEHAGDIHSWEAVPADEPERTVQSFAYDVAKRRLMLLPPGRYKLAVAQQQFESPRLLWPGMFKVEAGHVASAALTSGIRLIGASDDVEPSFDVRILADGDVVQSASGTWDVQIVPPGIYRVETRAKGREQWQTLSEKCAVKAGEVTELRYPGT